MTLPRIQPVRFELRSDTAVNWAISTLVLLEGEPAYATDTHELRVGDGTSVWSDLLAVTGSVTPADIASAVAAETLARISAVSAAVTAASADTTNQVAGEAAQRVNAVNALSAAVTGETAQRIAAVSAVSAAVSAEAVARISAASAASSAVSAETARALAAEAGLTPLTAAGRSALNLTEYDRLLSYFVKMGNRKSARVNIAMLGDSLWEGHPLTTYSKTIARSLEMTLRARFPTPGVAGGRGYVGIPTATARADTGLYPFVFTGGAFDQGAVFGGTGCKKNLWYTNASGNKVVYTPSGTLTSFDILHTRSTAGGASTGYYKIDNGAQTPFPCNAASNTPTLLHVPSAVTSSIEIGWNASGFLAFDGITEYNGDENAGIQVHNCGVSGAWANFMNTAPAGWPAAVKLLNPDLIILGFGTNDYTTTVGNRTAAQFKTDMTTLIASLRSAAITCPILWVAAWDTNLTKVEPWQNYITKMQEIAAADTTVSILDLTARFPAGGSALATTLGLYSDGVHSNTDGRAYGTAADAIAEAMRPR